MLADIFDKLATHGAVKVDGQPTLFFPNGIELIPITVEVGVMEVDVKVAGEKGVKGPLAEAVAT